MMHQNRHVQAENGIIRRINQSAVAVLLTPDRVTSKGLSPMCAKPTPKLHGMSFRDRLLAQTVVCPETGCWLWQGYKSKQGYGLIRNNMRRVLAHRAAYQEFVGPIPHGLELDHLCRFEGCINPDHLEPVTHAENVRRGSAGWNYRAKTHCPKGHSYSGDNLYINITGSRVCRTCVNERTDAKRAYQREYMRRWRAERKRGASSQRTK